MDEEIRKKIKELYDGIVSLRDKKDFDLLHRSHTPPNGAIFGSYEEYYCEIAFNGSLARREMWKGNITPLYDASGLERVSVPGLGKTKERNFAFWSSLKVLGDDMDLKVFSFVSSFKARLRDYSFNHKKNQE